MVFLEMKLKLGNRPYLIEWYNGHKISNFLDEFTLKTTFCEKSRENCHQYASLINSGSFKKHCLNVSYGFFAGERLNDQIICKKSLT